MIYHPRENGRTTRKFSTFLQGDQFDPCPKLHSFYGADVKWRFYLEYLKQVSNDYYMFWTNCLEGESNWQPCVLCLSKCQFNDAYLPFLLLCVNINHTYITYTYIHIYSHIDHTFFPRRLSFLRQIAVCVSGSAAYRLSSISICSSIVRTTSGKERCSARAKKISKSCCNIFYKEARKIYFHNNMYFELQNKMCLHAFDRDNFSWISPLFYSARIALTYIFSL